jgi:5'-deoxynucleotidase YfbR-like HD superfamily hydrolase
MLNTVQAANAYLSEFPGVTGSPQPGPWRDHMTARHLARAMVNQQRQTYNTNGERQTNAEHTVGMAHVAMQIVIKDRVDLDPTETYGQTYVHDLHEPYSGDTPINNAELLATKAQREAAGLILLREQDLATNPVLLGFRRRYDGDSEGAQNEAAFVHAVDKLEPQLTEIATGGQTRRKDRYDYHDLLRDQIPKVKDDSTTLELMVHALNVAGERWVHSWNCQPFVGEPYEAINQVLQDEAMPPLDSREKVIPDAWTAALGGRAIVSTMVAMQTGQIYPDGRAQNQAEHSYYVSLMTLQAAGSQRPELDINEVVAMLYAHDLHIATTLPDLSCLADTPAMGSMIQRYNYGSSAEARIVRAMKAYDPLEFALETKGSTLSDNDIEFPDLVNESLESTVVDPLVFHLSVDALRDIAKHWTAWQCRSFNIDPDMVIDRGIRQALKVHGLPATANRPLVSTSLL